MQSTELPPVSDGILEALLTTADQVLADEAERNRKACAQRSLFRWFYIASGLTVLACVSSLISRHIWSEPDSEWIADIALSLVVPALYIWPISLLVASYFRYRASRHETP
jgi:hypothetical protein